MISARILLMGVVMLLGVSPCATRAQTFRTGLLGDWQQLQSNAGACPACRIAIDQAGSGLAVSANNGWSARINVGRHVDDMAAGGRGQWNGAAGRGYAGRAFDAVFTLRGDRLYLVMTPDRSGGSRSTVKAVYGRLWFGS